jgi:hypothetical protein
MRITGISTLQEKQRGACYAIAQRHRCARKEVKTLCELEGESKQLHA